VRSTNHRMSRSSCLPFFLSLASTFFVLTFASLREFFLSLFRAFRGY
jgi:hypothetical protein